MPGVFQLTLSGPVTLLDLSKNNLSHIQYNHLLCKDLRQFPFRTNANKFQI